MAWINYGRNRYYCRSERRGKTVRRVHYGNGELARLVEGLDQISRLERETRARAWRDERARHEAADALLDGLRGVTDLVAEAALRKAGFHRHDRGPWRRRRVTDKDVKPAAGPLKTGDVHAVLEAARRGDRTVLPVLRRLLDESPQIWHALGDLAGHAGRAWVDLAAGTDLALSESIVRKIAALKAELTGPASSPLENLLVNRVVACWIQAHHADAVFAQSKGRDLSLAQLDHLQKRQERAGRSYLAAIKALAVVRKLTPAAPRPPATGRHECGVEGLPGAAGAAGGGSEKRVKQAPEAGKTNTKKVRSEPATRSGRAGTDEPVIPEPLRRRMSGQVGSKN